MAMLQKAKSSFSKYLDVCSYGARNWEYFPLLGKRIGYIGWLGHGNTGDEAMYQATSKAVIKGDVVPYRIVKNKGILADHAYPGQP